MSLSPEEARAVPPRRIAEAAVPCPVCGGVLRRLGMTENYCCHLGHQTTAKRLEEAQAR